MIITNAQYALVGYLIVSVTKFSIVIGSPPDYSLNCTPLGPITITYHFISNAGSWNNCYLFVQYLLLYFRLVSTWSRHITRKSNNFIYMILKSNAINAGLRTLEVTRVSVVLKACLVLSAFPSHIWISLISLSSYGEYFLQSVYKQTKR